jgi:hypothetical protein
MTKRTGKSGRSQGSKAGKLKLKKETLRDLAPAAGKSPKGGRGTTFPCAMFTYGADCAHVTKIGCAAQ